FTILPDHPLARRHTHALTIRPPWHFFRLLFCLRLLRAGFPSRRSLRPSLRSLQAFRRFLLGDVLQCFVLRCFLKSTPIYAASTDVETMQQLAEESRAIV